MTVTLRPEQEKAIREALQSGAYRDASEVIDRALEVLRLEEEWLAGQRAAIAAKIERAFEQVDRGEFLSSEQSRADLQKRKAEWLAEHNR